MEAFSKNPKHFDTMAERKQNDVEEVQPLLAQPQDHDETRSRCVFENVPVHQPSEANAEQEEGGTGGT